MIPGKVVSLQVFYIHKFHNLVVVKWYRVRNNLLCNMEIYAILHNNWVSQNHNIVNIYIYIMSICSNNSFDFMKIFPNIYFSFICFEATRLTNLILERISDPINIDLHANLVILSFAVFTEGEINNPQNYP